MSWNFWDRIIGSCSKPTLRNKQFSDMEESFLSQLFLRELRCLVLMANSTFASVQWSTNNMVLQNSFFLQSSYLGFV